MFDAGQPLTITLTRTAGQWNEFLSYLDRGPHGVVRPIIDEVMIQAQRQQQNHSEAMPPSPSRSPPHSNARKGARAEYEPAVISSSDG